MEKYYKILGVTAYSTQEEIRKKYRKLVMRYHPDKNPSKQAAHQFLLIKEAYEIITGKIAPPPVHRPKPATKTTQKRTTTVPKPNQAERVKVAKDRFKEQQLREELENELYFRKLTTGRRWKVMKIIAIVGFVAALGMILDRFLPRHFEEDRVTHYYLNKAYSISGKPLSIIKTQGEHFFWVSDINYVLYSKAPNVYIERSWLFHDPVRVIARDKVNYEFFPIHYTFYRHFIVILIFMLPAFVLWYRRKTIFFTVAFLSSYYGVSTLLIYYLISGDRWAHFLTLGFL